MKYLTKEVYALGQKSHLYIGLHISETAEIFSEDNFKKNYELELNKYLQKKKELSALTADEIYPLDEEISGPIAVINKNGAFSANEYLSPEDFEKERNKMIEERKIAHDNYVSEIYDEAKIRDDFYKGYIQSLKRIKKDYPDYILKDIADIRILALNIISQENYDKLKTYCI